MGNEGSGVDPKLLDLCDEYLYIPMDKKVILYAPTWRDNSYVAAGYTFELKADFHKWKEILQEEYVVLFKPHYLIINNLTIIIIHPNKYLFTTSIDNTNCLVTTYISM